MTEIKSAKARISFILLLLCASIMPFTVLQFGSAGIGVDQRTGGGGGGRGGGGGGGNWGGGGGNRPGNQLPPGPGGGYIPGPSQPTARPGGGGLSRTINQPTAMPSFSRTWSGIGTSYSFSFSRSWTGISSWTGITSWTGSWTGITRTTVTSYTLSPTFTWGTTTAYYYPYWDFYHTGYGYNSNSGSFTLSQTFYDQNGNACLYYDYFGFSAMAGQIMQGNVWTAGWPIGYMVIPMGQVGLFQAAGCAVTGQGQTVSSPYSLYWVAPSSGDYALIFYSPPPYSGPVYFTLG